MSEENNNSTPASKKKYRTGKRERAVRAYTINQESKYIRSSCNTHILRYLLVKNVPHFGIEKELSDIFSRFGPVQKVVLLFDYPTEEFMDAYWIKFEKLVSAQQAKRELDEHPFYGSLLDVSYAPQFETVTETREKLLERKSVVLKLVTQQTSPTVLRKRKQDDDNG